MSLYWQSSVCKKVEIIDLPSDYALGDSEPCLCGDLLCAAEVKWRREWRCLSCSETIEHRATECPACGGDTFTEKEYP